MMQHYFNITLSISGLCLLLLLKPTDARSQAGDLVDSLRLRLELTNSPTDSIALLHQLIDKYYQQDHWTALSYAQEALDISDRQNALSSRVKSHNLLGLVFRQMGNYDLAIQHLDQGLALNRDLEDLPAQLDLLRDKGNTLQAQGRLEEAIGVYYDGLHLSEKENLNNYLNAFYTAIAQVKWLQEDTSAARQYYESSLEILDDDASDRQKGVVYYNYAIFMARMGYYEEALARLQDVLAYFEGPSLTRNRAITLGAIGELYTDMGEFDRARDFLHLSLREKKSLGMPETTAFAYHSLGNLMDTLNLLDSAMIYYQAGLDLVESTGEDMNLKRDLHRDLAGSLEKLGRKGEALEHFRKYMVLEERMWEEIDRATTTEIEKKYNFGKQQGENTALRAENELNEIKLSQQRLILFAVLGLLASSIVIGLLLVRQARRKRLLAQTIANHQATLHQERVQRLQRESENRAINAMMDGQEQERHRIAEALHSSLGSILSAIQMHYQTIREKIDPSRDPLVAKTGKLIEEACQSNRRIAHELLPPVLLKMGLEPAIQQLAEKLETPDIEVETSFFGLTRRLPENLELTIYRAIDELLNNIMKHADADHVAIQLTEHEKELNIMVEDNGKGFAYDPENPDYGLGLTHLSSRVRYFGGSFEIDSSPGSGTTIIINLPLDRPEEQADSPHPNERQYQPQ